MEPQRGRLLLANKSHSTLHIAAWWTPQCAARQCAGNPLVRYVPLQGKPHSCAVHYCTVHVLKMTQPSSWSPTAHPFCSIPEHSAVEVWIPPTFWGYFSACWHVIQVCSPTLYIQRMLLEGRGCWGNTNVKGSALHTTGYLLGCMTRVAYLY